MATTENTWSDGDVATAALLNNLEDTVIVRCDSASRPTGVEGRVIYETDTNKLMMHDGASWKPIGSNIMTYTPTITNVTVGNGTVDGWYYYVGGAIHFAASFTFGSTSSISNAPKFSLPVATSTAPDDADICGVFIDGGTAYSAIHAAATTTTTGFLYVAVSSGTYVVQGSVSSSVPFTWTTGDEIHVSGTYRL